MEINIINMSSLVNNKVKMLKIEMLFKNNAPLDYNLKDFQIKSPNAQFFPCLNTPNINKDLNENKFIAVKIPSQESIAPIIYKPVKVFNKKKKIGKCNGVIILKKYYVFSFKLPVEFNIQ
ncbi:hypothetical protein CDIK_1651 [Cucumispora dikerogammari]|nr:hypothetical protein CDIK_1651 [Cucumispora dikerogammari]